MFDLGLFELLIIGFIAVVVIGLVVMVIVFATTASRNREVARLAGVDAVQGQAQAFRGVVDALAAGAAAPRTSQMIEARLQELDDLRSRGVISYDEYVAARQRAIEGRSAP